VIDGDRELLVALALSIGEIRDQEEREAEHEGVAHGGTLLPPSTPILAGRHPGFDRLDPVGWE